MVKKIICCCRGGMGSSLIVRINVNDVLKRNGYDDIEVEHLSIGEIYKDYADIFVVALDLEDSIKQLGIINYVTIKNLMSLDEIESVLIPKIKEMEEAYD